MCSNIRVYSSILTDAFLFFHVQHEPIFCNMQHYAPVYSDMEQYVPVCSDMRQSVPYSLICGSMSKYALIRKLQRKTLQYAKLLSNSQYFHPACWRTLEHTKLCCSSLSSIEQMLWYVLIINQREALISQIYFWNRTLHVSDSISVHHQESSTVHTATGVGHTGYADCLLAGSGSRCTVLCQKSSDMYQYASVCYL